MLLLCSCTSAQNVKVINAKHFTRIGGVEGSRAVILEITLTRNSIVEVKSLNIGKVEIPLNVKTEKGEMFITGTYFPEEPTIQQNYEGEGTATLDFENTYLIYKDLSTNQLNRMKIKFSSNHQTVTSDDQLPE